MTDVVFTPALELARLIRDKAVSSVEVTSAFLDRIDRLDARVGAFITVAADQALDAARAADDAVVAGARVGPFHGVPLGIKDVVDTAGIRTTHGSGAWRDRVPDRDHAVVTKLKDGGFVVLGKTKMPEFSGGVVTEPAAYGPARNPWDLDRSPGGSSGGSGAAVAAGLVPIAHGSDDGGSIRIPSAWCGLVGIKPSRGRISCAPDPQATEFTSGPMARTVADAAAMLDVMSGYVAGDAFWAPPPARSFAEEVGADPGRLRIAVTTSTADGVAVDPAVVAATLRAAKLLAELGHEVVEVDDWPGRGAFPDNRVLPLHLIYGARYDARIRAGAMPPFEELDPVIQLIIQGGRSATASDLLLAERLAADTSRAIVEMFESYDVLVTPVTACQPPQVGRFDEHPEESLQLLDSLQWTAQFSVSGQPAMAIPVELDGAGMPVGVQLAGRAADEATLIRVATQLETVNPWADRRPVLA